MFDFLKSGELSKLKVQSWSAIGRDGDPDLTFEAFINPDEFTLNYNVIFETRPAPGRTGTPAPYLGTQPLEVTLKFYLDGTKATGQELDVGEKIENFYSVVGYDGTKHRPRYLRILWGKLTLLRNNQYAFDCVLKSASLQYKLFKPDGKPLRVIINATFTEALDYARIEEEHRNESPDLTHIRVVKEGDTLPALTYKVYGDYKYYLEVAKANNLLNFRNLTPGQQLFFPPFDKNVKEKNNA